MISTTNDRGRSGTLLDNNNYLLTSISDKFRGTIKGRCLAMIDQDLTI